MSGSKPSMFNVTNTIETWVELMEWDTLIAWADILKVEHDESNWFDDTWSEHVSDLRESVTVAILVIGCEETNDVQN